MASTAPRRAYHLTAELGADSLEDLIYEIRHMLMALDRGSAGAVGGGGSSGGHWTLVTDKTMTHERYHEAINAWLAGLDQEHATEEEHHG